MAFKITAPSETVVSSSGSNSEPKSRYRISTPPQEDSKYDKLLGGAEAKISSRKRTPAEAVQRKASAFEAGFKGSLSAMAAVPSLAETNLGIESPIGRASEQVRKNLRDEVIRLAPTDPNLADMVAQGLGSASLFFIPGFAAARTVAAIGTIAPAIATITGVATSTVLESATEAGDTYSTLVDQGVGEHEAARKANIVFAKNIPLLAITNKLGDAFKLGGKVLPKIGKGVLFEGAQEAGQSVIGQQATRKPGEPIDVGQAATEGLVGGIVGGGIGGVSGVLGRESVVDKKPLYGPGGVPVEVRPEAKQPSVQAQPVEVFQETKENAPIFYSQLERSIQEKMPNAASSEQVRGILKGTGIKQEEVDWLDVEGFLQGKEKVSKQELLDYVKSNNVKVEEVVKGGKVKQVLRKVKDLRVGDRVSSYEDEPAQAIDDIEENEDGTFTITLEDGQQLEEMSPSDKLDVYSTNKNIEQTKFSSYQLPGGENYRELLLKLPDKDSGNVQTSSKNFISPHFEETNVLAHVRMNDRVDSDGKKVLFIEEVQSDWHQQGKKEGYIKERGGLTEEQSIRQDSLLRKRSFQLSVDEKKELEEFNDIVNRNRRAAPNAPFKKTWHELALKRMLRYAAENGYDRLAWTTGEQQAERYDLSKKVSQILFQKRQDGTYNITADPISGPDTISLGSAIPENKLADIVGKDVSEKIIKRSGEKYSDQWKAISGLDLKVGGEGMKGFYDQILPSYLNKYAKRWGGRVGESTVKTKEYDKWTLTKSGDTGRWWFFDKDSKKVSPYFTSKSKAESWKIENGGRISEQESVHSIDITPSMKNSVLSEGQPLFQRGEGERSTFKLEESKLQSLFQKHGVQDVVVVMVNNILTPKGTEAVGSFVPAERKVKLTPRPLKTTGYHEAFHVLVRKAGMEQQYKAAVLEVMEDYGVESSEAEEILADQFAEYANQRTGASLSSKVKQFFGKILDYIRRVMGSNPKSMELFGEILNPKTKSGLEESSRLEKEMFFQEEGEDKEERTFSRRIREDDSTPPEVKKKIELFYEVVHDEPTLAAARNLIASNPEMAMQMVYDPSDKTKLAAVTAELMADEFLKSGRNEEAIHLIEATAKKATEGGQFVQAFSIWSRLNPAAALRFAQKQVNKYNARTGDDIKISSEQSKKISDQAEKARRSSPGRERTIESAKLMDEISRVVPPSFWSQVSFIQTLAQLLNPKTAIRNLLGNVGFAVTENASDSLAAALDIPVTAVRNIYQKLRGLPTTTRSKVFPGMAGIKAQFEGMRSGAKVGFEDAWNGIDTAFGRTKFDLPRTAQFRGSLGRKVQFLLDFELKVPDRAFFYAAYQGSLDNQMRAAGVSEATEEMREIATLDGLYRTFQDDSFLARGFSKVKEGLNWLTKPLFGGEWGLGDLLIKYPRTPANILLRGLDYSPAGFVKAVGKLARPAFQKGPFDQKGFVEATSRALVGSVGLIGVGFMLHQLGIIAGRREKDKDIRAIQRSVGLGQYKINVSALKRFFLSGFDKKEARLQPGDTLASYDWFLPSSIPLAIGANLSDHLQGGEGNIPGAAFVALEEGVDTLSEQPLVSGVKRFFEARSVSAGLMQAAAGAPASFIPTLLNQVRQLSDNSFRETRDQNKFKEAVNLVKSKIPGLSKSLPISRNPFGQRAEVFVGGGNTPINVFLNPAFVTKYAPTPEAKLVLDIYTRSGQKQQAPKIADRSVTVNGRKIELSGESYEQFQKYTGEMAQISLARLARDPEFAKGSDEEKAKYIGGLLSDIGTAAKIELLGHRPKREDSGVVAILVFRRSLQSKANRNKSRFKITQPGGSRP